MQFNNQDLTHGNSILIQEEILKKMTTTAAAAAAAAAAQAASTPSAVTMGSDGDGDNSEDGKNTPKTEIKDEDIKDEDIEVGKD